MFFSVPLKLLRKEIFILSAATNNIWLLGNSPLNTKQKRCNSNIPIKIM